MSMARMNYHKEFSSLFFSCFLQIRQTEFPIAHFIRRYTQYTQFTFHVASHLFLFFFKFWKLFLKFIWLICFLCVCRIVCECIFFWIEKDCGMIKESIRFHVSQQTDPYRTKQQTCYLAIQWKTIYSPPCDSLRSCKKNEIKNLEKQLNGFDFPK